MGKEINISEAVIVSLLKSLITEESSGDTCKDKLGYNTIATANQIVQFQTGSKLVAWSEKDNQTARARTKIFLDEKLK